MRLVALPGRNSSAPANLADVNGVLYFTADDGVNGVELWRSDGTDAGTVRLASVNASFTGLTNFGQLTTTGNTLYLTAFEPTTGIELWKYDVAANTLQRLTDTAPGPVSSNPSELTVIGSSLFFAADAGTRSPELWKSDGTLQGTVRVSSDPRGVNELTAAGSTLFFTANDAQGDVACGSPMGRPQAPSGSRTPVWPTGLWRSGCSTRRATARPRLWMRRQRRVR